MPAIAAMRMVEATVVAPSRSAASRHRQIAHRGLGDLLRLGEMLQLAFAQAHFQPALEDRDGGGHTPRLPG
jgi:hypothetical protein